MTNVLALPAGTGLAGDFRIERMLGAGGFGITYLAEEIALRRRVTIKEYFPVDFAARGKALTAIPRDADSEPDFQWGLDRFVDEARTLARFDHRNIVKVYRHFEANGTAYMVLHFEEGKSLKGWLKDLGRFPRQRELDDILRPLLEALEVIHNADFLHRDIAPDNIIIRNDGSPVLIDFGSARGDIAKHSRTISALVKPGYSPYEQYAENGERQGPWTDIYALGATLYHTIGGKRPPDAPSRVVKDDMPSAVEIANASYRRGFLAAIDKSLALDPTRRPQSIAEWRGDLLAPDPTRPGWLRRLATGRKNESADEAAVIAAGAASVPVAQPPLPDVPGPKGGLIDYIDRMKAKVPAAGEPGPFPFEISEPPATPSGGRKPKSVPSSLQGKGSGARPGSAPQAAARSATNSRRDRSPRSELLPAQVVPKPPRPRAHGGSMGRWLSLGLTLLLGGGLLWASLGSLPSDISANDVVTNVHAIVTSASLESARLVTGSLRRATQLERLEGHPGGTSAVAFTPDGRSIVTTGADGTLKIWDAKSGTLSATHMLDKGVATAFALRGRRALTGHADGSVDLWDIDSGTRLARFKRNDANIWSVTFAGDDQHILASSHDWTTTLWDARKPAEPLAVLDEHNNAVQSVAYTSRGPYIATGSADKTIKLWRAGDLSVIRTYRGHKEYVSRVAFSPDGRLIAAAALDGRIRIWSTSSRSLYRLGHVHRAPISGLAFSPAGDLLASTADDGSVRIWAFRSGRHIQSLSERAAPARALAFSPDGERLAVAMSSGPVRIWNAQPEPRRR